MVKSENLEEWQMDIKVLDTNPLYLDQTYRLKFTFSNKYPIGKLFSAVIIIQASNPSSSQNPPRSNSSSAPNRPAPPVRSPSTPTSIATASSASIYSARPAGLPSRMSKAFA